MARTRSPLAPVALAVAVATGLALFGRQAFVPQGALPLQQVGTPSELTWGLRPGAGLRGQVQLMATDTLATVGKAKQEPEATSLVASPKEAYFTMVDRGEVKGNMTIPKILHQAILGGAFIGFGSLLSLSIAGNLAGAESSNPGLGRLVGAVLFPVNMLLIVLTGAQLFSGNTCTMSGAYFEGRVTLAQLAKVWAVSLLGNMFACFLMAAATQYTGLLVAGTKELAIATCVKKTANSFGHNVVAGIGANWLVCMAVFLSSQARDMGGKMVGIWFPISTFVAIGLEHAVANFYLLPAGVLAGAPVTYAQVFLRNFLPVILGNTIAGVLFVAASYSFAYGRLGGH